MKDDTGDRRFWVIPVKEIDLERLTTLPDAWFIQLWAEVYGWWQSDPQCFRLSRMERLHLEELNREYREFLPGEEEILEALDWELPPERWGDFTPKALRDRVFFLNNRVTVQQVGRVLAKLARADRRIKFTVNSISKSKTYRLPILATSVAGS